MRRRTFLTIAAMVALAPHLAHAQVSGRTYRIAIVGGVEFQPAAGGADGAGQGYDPETVFRQRLAERGFVEGRNLQIRRFASSDDTAAGLTGAVREAIAWKPDAIRVGTTKDVRLVATLTSTIPVVFDTVNDPVGSGLVASMARPGGNLTGVAIMQADLTSKRLELVREFLPRAKRVALIVDTANRAISPEAMKQIDVNARKLGLVPTEFDTANDPQHLVGTLDRIAKARPDAVVYILALLDARDYRALDARAKPRPRFVSDVLVDFQRVHRIPVVYTTPQSVERGIVAAIGQTNDEQMRIVADQMMTIFRGTPAGEIPVQQFSRIEVAVNLSSAKALGITFPESVLIRADRVVK